MANVITTRARDSFSTNQEKLDFAEGIALLDPNENPFTLMTMKFGRGTAGSIEHKWLYDELVPETDTVDTTSTCVTAGTTLRVDNVDRFMVGDIVMRNATRETFLVTARAQGDGNGLTIVRDYGSTSGAYTALAGSFEDEDVITIIGNAFEEGHDFPDVRSTTLTELVNYCQDQRTPFSLTEVAAAASTYGENDWTWQEKKAAITHQRKLEYQNIWGHPMPGDKGVYDGSSNTNPAAGGGLWHFLTGGTGFSGTGSDRLVSQAELTQSEFLSFLEAVFEYGSAQKVMFCAPLFRTAMDTWGISKLNTFSEKTVYGMNVATWVSAHGTIVFVTHKMLKDDTEGNVAFIVDMNDLRWITYSNIGSTRRRELKPYEADGSTVKKAEYQTISCLEVKTPKKHGAIYGTLTIGS